MRALTIALCLLAIPVLADVAGVASVIDGDTLEIHGQRIRFHEWASDCTSGPWATRTRKTRYSTTTANR